MGQYDKGCWLPLCWVIRTCMHLLTFHGTSVIRMCMCRMIRTCMQVLTFHGAWVIPSCMCRMIRTCMHVLTFHGAGVIRTFHGASVIRTCMCWVIQTCMRVPKHFQPLDNYLQRANMRTPGGVERIQGVHHGDVRDTGLCSSRPALLDVGKVTKSYVELRKVTKSYGKLSKSFRSFFSGSADFYGSYGKL